MKYPFTPQLLDAMPEELSEMYRKLELDLLERISKQLTTGKLNAVSLNDIRTLRSHGVDLKDIRDAIAKQAKIGKQELDTLFADAVSRNQRYYNGVADLASITLPDALVDAQTIKAIVKQTENELANITRTMGFTLDGGRTRLPVTKVYNWALDRATMAIQSGSTSYGKAIADATRELADAGITTVNYESGRTDHIDVAVRRAVMTGIVQLNSQYNIQSMGFLKADYVEVSAHSGARDKGEGFENHKDWQGKVYYWRQMAKGANTEHAPDFESTCGYGDVQGILGANCRHSFSPFIPDVMERTYTDEQLKNIDPPPFEYQGVTYSHYEATQKQREIERTVRKWERRKAAATDPQDRQIADIRIRRLKTEYKQFSEKAGLRTQPERMKAYTKENAPIPKIRNTAPKAPKTTPPKVTPPPKPKTTPFKSTKLANALGNDYNDFAAQVEKSDARPLYDEFSDTVRTYTRKAGAGCYRGGRDDVEWDLETKHYGKDKFSVLAHESGHAFDKHIASDTAKMSKLSFNEVDVLRTEMRYLTPVKRMPSSSDEFLKALRADMSAIEADISTISRDMVKNARNASHGVQDALDGFFGARTKGLVRWGHGERYYNREFNGIERYGEYNKLKAALQKAGHTARNRDQVRAITRQYEAASEAWANVTEAVTNGGDSLKAMRKWMPNTLDCYLDILGRWY